jgi:hypothetical protein
MNYTTDPTYLMMLLILPSLFGLTLIGEGVNKVMNYEPRGWINVCLGAIFVVVIIVGYFLVSTSIG